VERVFIEERAYEVKSAKKRSIMEETESTFAAKRQSFLARYMINWVAASPQP
jgi:hypothetical protein